MRRDRRLRPSRDAGLDHHRVGPEREQLPDDRLLPLVPERVARDDHERPAAGGAQHGSSVAGALVEAHTERARPEIGEAVQELARGDVRRRHELDDERIALERRRTVHAERAARGLRADLAPLGAGRIGGRGPPRCGRHPARRLLEPLERKSAGARGLRDRVDQRVDRLLVQVVADAERVRAGRERLHRGLLDADAAADRAHLERVRDHEPVEPQLLAQEPGQNPAAQRGGQLVQTEDEQVRGHHSLHARGDRRPERQQRRLEVAGHDREVDVRVDGGVTVPGEVLRTGGDSLPLCPANERRDVTGDELRIGAEAAHADHGIVRVRVGVRDGREVQVDSGARELGRDRRRHLLGQLDVVDCAERQVPWVRAAALGLEPGDVAALLVDRHEDLAGVAQPGGQRRELRRIADVVGEERDPTEPTLEPAEDPVGDLVAGKAGQQAGRRETLDAHDLTAPAVRPKAIRRCRSTKKMTTGTAVSVAPAISEPQSVPRRVVKLASQIVSVCFSWLESRT